MLPQRPDITLAQAAAASAYAAHERAKGQAKRMHHDEREEVPPELTDEVARQVATVDEIRKLDRVYEVVKRRALGWSSWEISEDMQLSIAQVNDALGKAREYMTQGITDLQAVCFQTELMRSDMLIRRYMAQAMMPQVIVEAIEKGQPVTREALEYPMRAALIVLEVMKFRMRLLGLDKSKASKADEGELNRSGNVIGFLRSQLEFVQAMVDKAPRDVLVEVTELSGNGAGNNHQKLEKTASADPGQSM